jgi:ADP-ribosyl-[dinitrogen reductase] hydrolase
VDVLSWDERSVLSDRGVLPLATGERLNRFVSGETLIDRYRGAMLGLAIGDALGRPLTGLTPAGITSSYGLVNRYLSGPFPGFLLPAGQLGHDTQMALALAGSIISVGRFDPREYSQRLMAWHPVARSAGKSVTSATLALRNGTSWLQSGTPSAGKGAAARAVPIGLLHPADLDMLRFDAAVQTLITHSDHTAIGAAIAMAASIAHLTGVADGAFDATELYTVIERSLQGIELPELPLRHLPARSTLLTRVAVALDQVGSTPESAYAAIRTGGFLLEAFPLALWAFASAPENPVGALILAVNGGGAANSIGAMAGALAGAYRGASSLPSAWVDHLEYVDGIAGHADSLAEAAGVAFAAEPMFQSDLMHPASFAPFQLGGSTMPTLEHAIRSASAADPATAVKIRLLPTPADVRRFSSMTETRADWSTGAAGTVSAILKRRFGGHDAASDQLRRSATSHLALMGGFYAQDPFDYAELLSTRRSDLVGVRA